MRGPPGCTQTISSSSAIPAGRRPSAIASATAGFNPASSAWRAAAHGFDRARSLAEFNSYQDQAMSILTASAISRAFAIGIALNIGFVIVEAADKDIDSLHSLMLLRHGHVVADAPA